MMRNSEISKSIFVKLSGWSLLLAVATVPIFFIPSVNTPFLFTKSSYMALLVILSLIFFIIARLQTKQLTLPKHPLVYALFAVPLAYILSTIFAASDVGFLGNTLATDTAGFMLLSVIAALLVVLVFTSRGNLLKVYLAFLLAAGLVALFQLLRLIGGADFLSFGLFNSASSGPFGLLNELGMFFGLITVLSLVSSVGIRLRGWTRLLIFLPLVVSLLFLIVTNVKIVWWGVGITALGAFVYSVMQSQFQRDPASVRADDSGVGMFSSLAVLALSLVFLFGSQGVTSAIAGWFSLGQLDVRPSWKTTFEISQSSLSENLVFGAGPQSFQQVWAEHRPLVTNQTIAWNTDFASGIGFVPTSVISTGLFGLLAWMTFFGVFLYTGVRTLLFGGVGESVSFYLSLSSFLGALYLWIITVLSSPNATLIFFAFLITGIFIASLRHRPQALEEVSVSFIDRPRLGFVSVLLLTLLVLGSVAGLFSIGERYAAAVQFQTAVQTANRSSDPVAALETVSGAIALNEQARFYSFSSALELARIQQLLAQSAEPTDADRVQFQALLGSAIRSANRATELQPNNYQNWLQLGLVYRTLVPLQIEGAYDNSKRAFERAAELRPASPAIIFAQSQLEVAAGNTDEAIQLINQALVERPNYADAMFALAQIQIAEGDLEAATASVEAGTFMTPNNPVAFFQLGILRYSQENYAQAASALERAVALNEQYANARYFLGLSYFWLDRADDAIEQFEFVQASNPDNEEVASILSNMRAGENPFGGGPVQIPPEEPSPDITELESLPIEEGDPEVTSEEDSSAIDDLYLSRDEEL